MRIEAQKLVRSNALLIGLLICMANVFAQDWPQYLGPDRNSMSPQINILRSWPESGPEVLWTVEVGSGNGGPIVKDGNYIYSCGHNGDLYCIDINTHEPVWNKNVWTDFGGGVLPRWAIVQCPLVYGDLLILASQAPDAGVVAYEKLTGHVKWTTEFLGPVGYVSPSIVKIGKEDHVVMITAASGGRGEPMTGGIVVGIDPLSGKILWEYTNWHCKIPAPSAFDAGENKVLITGGYEAGAAMLQIEKIADGSYGVTELYKNVDFGAHTKPPLYYDGYFYAQYSTNNRRDGLVLIKAA